MKCRVMALLCLCGCGQQLGPVDVNLPASLDAPNLTSLEVHVSVFNVRGGNEPIVVPTASTAVNSVTSPPATPSGSLLGGTSP